MIYKQYELSRSLNGDKVVCIARNALGNVIFRATSESELQKMIDKSIDERRRWEESEAKRREEQGSGKNVKQDVVVEAEVVSVEELPVAPPIRQPRATRGPDGKFISKSKFETPEVAAKKTLWDKLKG